MRLVFLAEHAELFRAYDLADRVAFCHKQKEDIRFGLPGQAFKIPLPF